MDRTKIAIVLAGVLVSASEALAQSGPASSPRPFARLFATTAPVVPPTIRLTPRSTLPVLPPRCPMKMIPVDPKLDPKMSIAPPASMRFFMQELPPACR